MSDPSLAFQKALRSLLVSNSAVAALVPASAILDRARLPETFPCIIIGDGEVQHARPYSRFFERVQMDLHCWTEEDGTAGVKAIAAAVYDALNAGPWSIAGFQLCGGLDIQRTRFLRDQDGRHAHAVISIEAKLQS